VATSAAGATTLSYVIPGGADGTYYARLTAAAGTNGLFSQYLLSIDIVDTVAPTITGDTLLPAQGTTSTGIVDRFTLPFSEDMAPATVNNPANYDLRSAGPDNNFDTADDVLYTVASPGYGSGLASGLYRVSDGPLQPGSYRLR